MVSVKSDITSLSIPKTQQPRAKRLRLERPDSEGVVVVAVGTSNSMSEASAIKRNITKYWFLSCEITWGSTDTEWEGELEDMGMDNERAEKINKLWG